METCEQCGRDIVKEIDEVWNHTNVFCCDDCMNQHDEEKEQVRRDMEYDRMCGK